MIRRVAIRRFKRLEEIAFELPGHVVLAGPNNTGKSTVLQAIAAWDLALERWKRLHDFQRRGGAYPKAPIARQAFSAVPLRAFDLLWRERSYRGNIEIEVESSEGWTITMELIPDSTEQIYVRPKSDIEPGELRSARLATVFVPAMSGLSTEEPVYQRPKIDQLLGQARPGEVLRNLLVEVNQSEEAWTALQESIRRLFGYELLAPNAEGADILAEYRTGPQAAKLDIASAGSGFQQVLLLLTFLNTRPASVLLLDGPDAHLHVILQDAVYGELRSVAARQNSQLVIATHSEVIVNAVEPSELWVLLQAPRRLADVTERARLVDALRMLSNTEIMLAAEAPGILYVDGHTDLDLLREWARILQHPAYDLLTRLLFWRPNVAETRPGGVGVSAKDHYEALKLVREDLPGLQLLDGDARPEIPDTPITGQGLQRLRWRRYEIESYLIHPASLERFVEEKVGPGDHSLSARQDLRAYLEKTFRSSSFLLSAAGLPGFPYTRYHEMAAVMRPEEIHPEVIEKLDALCRAFRQ
jgi:predicted ATPase